MHIRTIEELDKCLKKVIDENVKDYPLENLAFEISNDRWQAYQILDILNTYVKFHKIVEETKVSYVTNYGHKINKKTLKYTSNGILKRVYLTYDDLLKALWVDVNKYPLLEKLRSSNDYDLYQYIYERLN